jgi:hypothetical protein
MKRIIVLFIMVTNMVFNGCSSYQHTPPSTISDIVISTTYDPKAKFPDTATYAFLRMEVLIWIIKIRNTDLASFGELLSQ